MMIIELSNTFRRKQSKLRRLEQALHNLIEENGLI